MRYARSAAIMPPTSANTEMANTAIRTAMSAPPWPTSSAAFSTDAIPLTDTDRDKPRATEKAADRKQTMTTTIEREGNRSLAARLAGADRSDPFAAVEVVDCGRSRSNNGSCKCRCISSCSSWPSSRRGLSTEAPGGTFVLLIALVRTPLESQRATTNRAP